VTRGGGIAVAAYVALLAAGLTGIYDRFPAGRDDSWAILLMIVAIHVGLGVAAARRWALLVPLALVAAFAVGELASGDAGGLDLVFLVVVAPLLVGVTAIGVAIGRRWAEQRAVIAAGCFAVAIAPAGWGTVETLQRGPHVPPSVQAALPIDIALGNLCPNAETPPDVERDIRRRTDALIRELRRRPNDLVTYTYVSSDEPDDTREITVRELAEEQLKSLDDVRAGGPECVPDLRRRILAAM
jgi:hypothetical protein